MHHFNEPAGWSEPGSPVSKPASLSSAAEPGEPGTPLSRTSAAPPGRPGQNPGTLAGAEER